MTALGQLAQAIVNEKEVNTTAYYIFKYYQTGNIQAAKDLYQYDGDKIPSYSAYYPFVKNLLGCRTHLKHNCKKPFCRGKWS